MNPPLKFVAIAFADYGGIQLEVGFEFYSAVVRVVGTSKYVNSQDY